MDQYQKDLDVAQKVNMEKKDVMQALHDQLEARSLEANNRQTQVDNAIKE